MSAGRNATVLPMHPAALATMPPIPRPKYLVQIESGKKPTEEILSLQKIAWDLGSTPGAGQEGVEGRLEVRMSLDKVDPQAPWS